MTHPYERELRRIFEKFIAHVEEVARRVAIHELLAGFARVSTTAIAVVPRPRRTPIDRDADRARIVECIQERPGMTTTELSESMDIHSSRLRRILAKLIEERAVEIRLSDPLFGGQRSHLYFPGQAMTLRTVVVAPASGGAT